MPAPSSHAPSRRGMRSVFVSTLVVAASCGAADEPPRQPLSAFAAEPAPSAPTAATPAPSTSSAHPVVLPTPAREGLDRGNAAFRRQDYAAAMRDYRAAAAAAPASAAPYFGVYMVAQKTGNPALADSAMRDIRRLSGSTLTTPEVQKLHRAAAADARSPR